MDGWRAHVTDDGSRTLVHPGHGEACHSRDGAWREARERYARPCRVAQLARDPRREGVVRLLDVGTGLGLNLAAALEAAAGARLEAWTLESDVDVLRAALRLGPDPRAGRWHAAVLDALERALAGPTAAVRVATLDPGAQGPRGRLHLALGDARARRCPRCRRSSPSTPCSSTRSPPRVAPALWEPAFLASVAARMTPRGPALDLLLRPRGPRRPAGGRVARGGRRPPRVEAQRHPREPRGRAAAARAARGPSPGPRRGPEFRRRLASRAAP